MDYIKGRKRRMSNSLKTKFINQFTKQGANEAEKRINKINKKIINNLAKEQEDKCESI